MQTTDQYIPTKGDLCYVITEKSNYGDAHRSFGAIVRIDKVRINHYRGKRSDQVSSATIEVSGVEGYRGGVSESHWSADFSRQLLPIGKATAAQVKQYAAARAKRAEAEAKVADERAKAEAFEKEFKAKHMEEVTAPTEFGEVIERKYNNERRYTFSCVRPYKRFKGRGFDITVEDGEDEMHVSIRWEENRWNDASGNGRWLFDYPIFMTVDAKAMDAHIRCAMAAQAKLAKLTNTALVAA